jgi:hypothetical protein
MSTSLGAVLGWKFDNEPGICTLQKDDGTWEITAWPASLGDQPTAEEIATYTADFEALPVAISYTPLDFIARFTDAEQSAISTACLSNAALNLWMMKAMGAQEIVVTDQRTIDGMNALIAAGLLTEARKTEILA